MSRSKEEKAKNVRRPKVIEQINSRTKRMRKCGEDKRETLILLLLGRWPFPRRRRRARKLHTTWALFKRISGIFRSSFRAAAAVARLRCLTALSSVNDSIVI